jgi:hypothetical protein
MDGFTGSEGCGDRTPLLDGGQNVGHVRLDVDLAPHLLHLAVRADHVTDAPCRRGIAARAGAVRHADFAVDVAEQQKRKRELFRECAVLCDGVEGDTQDYGAFLLEFTDSVTESAAFDGSARRVGLRIEPEHDGFAAQVREPDVFARVRRYGKIGSFGADLEHRFHSITALRRPEDYLFARSRTR